MLPTGEDSTLGVIKLKESLTGADRKVGPFEYVQPVNPAARRRSGVIRLKDKRSSTGT